jgi:hypothetical protein
MALRVPATRVGAIVKGERAVTADTALRLARFFGTSPEFWVNLQAMHDLTKARQPPCHLIAHGRTRTGGPVDVPRYRASLTAAAPTTSPPGTPEHPTTHGAPVTAGTRS